MQSDLLLPSEMELLDDNADKRRIEVWFFQDTSGSCAGLKDRFFNAARSLPTDRFDIRMFCFDEEVFETTLESGKLYGFRGTTFTCIEEYILKHTNLKYPDAVFVITDGAGNVVQPKKPENWYWFLSADYTKCIPKESHIYDLSNFE